MTPAAENAYRKALTFHRAGRARAALTWAEKAVAAAPDRRALRLLAIALALETDTPDKARAHTAVLLQANADDTEALHLDARAAEQQKDWADALKRYQRLLELPGGDGSVVTGMARALINRGQGHDAERALRRHLPRFADHGPLHRLLSQVLRTKDQADRALPFAETALRLEPTDMATRQEMAAVLQALRRPAEAVPLLEAVAAEDPDNADVWLKLARAREAARDTTGAREAAEKALTVNNDKKTNILYGTAMVLRNLKALSRAEEVLRHYLDRCPEDPSAMHNMALVCHDLEQYDQTVTWYRKTLERNPNNAVTHNNLAVVFMESARPEESVAEYRAARDCDPTYTSAHSNMLFGLNYLSGISREELFQEHRTFEHDQTEPLLPGAIVHANPPDSERPLRVGLISPDFCGHAVSYFTEPLLIHHNRDTLHLYVYANVPKPDGVTDRQRTYIRPERWHWINGLKDDEVFDLIQQDGIDILIDLAGHTAGNHLKLMSRRPAPVQATWIGYPNTTGLTTVDWRLVDAITDPEGDEAIHTERLWRLPSGFNCYHTLVAVAPKRTPPSAEAGHVTFASFNNLSKVSHETIAVWAEILKQVPDSRLILKSKALAAESPRTLMYERFATHGVDTDRLELIGQMPFEEHLRAYGRVDIGLDPFPYNGTTTTCEAMYMGVPVLTLLGDRHAARVGTSLVGRLGLDDLVATSPEDYVARAVALAADEPRRAAWRQDMRERMTASPLCDGSTHAREVEDALRGMWRTWCDQRRASPPPPRPRMRIIHVLGFADDQSLFRCLGSMDNVMLFSEVHPLGGDVFDPVQQAREWYDLLDDAETAEIQRKKLHYRDLMVRFYRHAQARGQTMLLRDWTHLDFLGEPYMPFPSFRLMADEALRRNFDLLPAAVVRHPADHWRALNHHLPGDRIPLPRFLEGYRRYVEAIQGMPLLRIEDFLQDPDRELQRLCDALDMPFDPGYADRWRQFSHITGAGNLTDEQRAALTLKPRAPGSQADPAVRQRLAENADYRAIVDMLGYPA